MLINIIIRYAVINLLVSIDVLTLAPPWLRQLALRTVPVSITFVHEDPKEPLYICTWAIVSKRSALTRYFLLQLSNKGSVWVAKTWVDVDLCIKISLPRVVFAVRGNLPVVGVAVGRINLYICATPCVARVCRCSYYELAQSNECQCSEILCLHDVRPQKAFHSCNILEKRRDRGDGFFFNILEHCQIRKPTGFASSGLLILC